MIQFFKEYFFLKEKEKNDYKKLGRITKHRTQKMLIKKDFCPICGYKIVAPNVWVTYHIRYNPPLTILACKYCNYTEFLLRNEFKLTRRTKYRAYKILKYHEKLGFPI